MGKVQKRLFTKAAVLLALPLVGPSVILAQTSPPSQAPTTPVVTPPQLVTSPTPSAGQNNKCKKNYYPTVKVSLPNAETTFVNVTVGADGSVKSVALAQSSGYQELDQAAIDCIVESWHFKPAKQDGQPVEVTKKYAIKWQLQLPPTSPTPAPNPQ
jgi:TonB family protein